METSSSPQAPKQNPNTGLWAGVSLVWELGYIIAVPAVAFGFLGAWIDKKYAVSPLFLALGLALAFVCSSIVVLRKVREIAKKGL